jgi:putative aldouronate transport system permease protein
MNTDRAITGNIMKTKTKKLNLKQFRNELPLHLMILPGIIVLILFSYVPMVGLLMAFQRFLPAKGLFGSKWVGLDNFKYLFTLPDFGQVIFNTIFIASLKILAGLIVPVTFALLLNEVKNKLVKSSIQTLVYLPHFLSWVILGGIMIEILSPSSGVVNQVFGAFGIEPIFFLGSVKWFPYTMVLTETWKEFGFNAVIYLAALTSIDPSLYESATVDGANRWKQTLNITIPGILPVVILMTVLSVGNVLNAGFDQVFNLYSPSVYESGDIIDTLVYRIGLVDMNYGLSTAAGLFKSVISLVLITISYKIAHKVAGYKIL